MLQGEHSAILSTFIKLPFSIKTFVLSIFKWPLKTGFTVLENGENLYMENIDYLLSWFMIATLKCYNSHAPSTSLSNNPPSDAFTQFGAFLGRIQLLVLLITSFVL